MEQKIKFLTQDELKRLFKTIKKDKSRYHVRNLAIFSIAYRCALRASEVGMVKVEDFNEFNGELYCRRVMGGENNIVKLDKSTLKVLDKYMDEYKKKGSSGTLFSSQQGGPISRKTLDVLMKKYCLLAGIEDISKYHFQTIKHSMAVHLAEKKLDISKTQQWLGHKYCNYTYIYYRVAENNDLR